jgi:hypothetical protein
VVVVDDGKGTGKTAEVNDDNQMRTRSTSHTEEHFASQDEEQAYLVSTSQVAGIPTLTFLDTEGGDVLTIRNTGTVNMVITSILVSANAAGGIMTVYKNRVFGTLTQNTVVEAKNLNFGSAKISTTEVDVWDETNGDGIQGLSGGDIMRAFAMPAAGITIETSGSVIIPQGKSLTINFINNSGNTIEFESGFRYCFDNEIIK